MLGLCCCHWDLGTFAKCSCPLQGEGTEGALSFRLNSAPRVKGNLHFPCAPALLRGGSRGIHTSSWDWGAEGRDSSKRGCSGHPTPCHTTIQTQPRGFKTLPVTLEPCKAQPPGGKAVCSPRDCPPIASLSRAEGSYHLASSVRGRERVRAAA